MKTFGEYMENVRSDPAGAAIVCKECGGRARHQGSSGGKNPRQYWNCVNKQCPLYGYSLDQDQVKVGNKQANEAYEMPSLKIGKKLLMKKSKEPVTITKVWPGNDHATVRRKDGREEVVNTSSIIDIKNNKAGD